MKGKEKARERRDEDSVTGEAQGWSSRFADVGSEDEREIEQQYVPC
jgi:hypothetical protein